jgi:F0F1-type ATP synthase assembly protein I
MPDQETNRRETYRAFALGQVGLEMVAPMIIGVILDRTFDWTPWGTVVGFVLGFIGGFLHLLTILKQPQTNNQPGGEKSVDPPKQSTEQGPPET